MKIFPAIDLIGKKVVRLYKGDYDKVTQYSSSPLDIAYEFKAAGATHLHVVDLDGAKDGTSPNFEVVKEIAEKSGLFVEIGGGVRNEERIVKYLEAGVKRVILGTVAVKDFKFTESMGKKYGANLAVGVDALNQKVCVGGWKEVTDIDSLEFSKRVYDAGIENVIYTDISKDGTLSGTNIEIYKKLGEIKGLKVTASGGVTFIDEIKKLKDIGVYAVILGKALYEKKLSLKDALALED
ncbi:MAG: 1-(5-phosphoribosyl)-5-[(5-phosphoribosylamino)methylideneamino]imidazole-4-carboxamide isomerase [Clostridiales bacterium]|nr:1-(5-phosphoribosyl)-5-[(5-phosphoribosylamino)methylideneamino]imidazole-4-carboxamide isomerase [Clostridiales bacterium]